jgi:hypothetical protein
MVGHHVAGEDFHPDPKHAGTPNFRDQYVVRLLQDGYDDLNNVQITAENAPYLDVYPADIILLHIGTNDILNGEGTGVETVSAILDEIDGWEVSNGAKVNVFVAKIVNTFPTRSEITTFNSNLEAMVAGRADPRVILVDMENGSGIEYSSTDFEADGIHLTQSGYDKIGAAWSAAVVTFLSATPEAPGDLSITEITSNSLRVNWTDNSFDETGFEIHRSLTSASGFTLIHTTGSDVESFIDNTVSPGETYFYRVCSVNDNGKSEYTPSEGATTPEDNPDSRHIGNVNIYSSTTTSPNRRAMQVTFPESGIVQSISIYQNGGSGSMQLGIYGDASGVPGSRLGITPAVPVSSEAGWQTIDLSSPVAVNAGDIVWLAWVFEDNPGIRYTAGTPARAHSSETWSGGMPTVFGSSNMDDYKYSLYCSYSTSGYSNHPEDKFLVFPNPATDKVTVSWNLKYNNGLVLTLVNSTGQKVSTLNTDHNQNEVELNLNEYTAGLYLLIIKNPEKERVIYRARVVKIN